MSDKTQWIEGVRGLAAFQVVTHHVVWAVAPRLLRPSTDGRTSFLQWPLVDITFAGTFSVAEFVVIAAFVSALKPLRQARVGNREDALTNIAKSAFRRTFRLALPVAALTFIAWTLCQLGAFRFANAFRPSSWVVGTSPVQSDGVVRALVDLWTNNFTTWSTTENVYEKNFWLMKMFLQASFYGYTVLLAMTYVQRRASVYVALYAYAFVTLDAVVGINVIAGIALADVLQSTSFQRFVDQRTYVAHLIAVPTLVVGLAFASFPLFDAEAATWSNVLVRLCDNVLLPQYADKSRYCASIGAQLILVALSLSSSAQRLLARPSLVWMGAVSWPVYLVHGTIIRTVFIFLVYGVVLREQRAETDAIPTKELVALFVALPFFYALVYGTGHVWSAYVDPACNRVAKWMEEKIFQHDVVNANKETIAYLPLSTTG